MSHEDLDDEFGGGKKEKSFEIPCASLVFSSFEERKKRSVKEKEKKRRKMFKQRKEENDSKSRRVSKEPLRIIGGSCSLHTDSLVSIRLPESSGNSIDRLVNGIIFSVLFVHECCPRKRENVDSVEWTGRDCQSCASESAASVTSSRRPVYTGCPGSVCRFSVPLSIF